MAGSEQFQNIVTKTIKVLSGGKIEAPAGTLQSPDLDGKLTATKGAAVPNAVVAADGTSAGTQLNALLTSLRDAGIINQ